ncbi:hypothetical protein KKA96_02885 [Patescibacteria group bacterium]|nr:hypothetical protein [Patescibacteria group bacterium]
MNFPYKYYAKLYFNTYYYYTKVYFSICQTLSYIPWVGSLSSFYCRLYPPPERVVKVIIDFRKSDFRASSKIEGLVLVRSAELTETEPL